MKTVNIGLLVGIAIFAVVGISVLSFTGVLGGASKYVTFEQAKGETETVHVVGKWVNREQSFYDSQQDVFQFYMQDSTNAVSLVRFHDPKPVNFETAEQIVIEGKYEGDSFEADRILMKCPSKYNDGNLETIEAEAS